MNAVEPDEDLPAPSALFLHVCKTYETMARRADEHTVQEGSESIGMLVYEGYLTKLITHDLNLSVPYYSSIMKTLIKMGCVIQLKRGGGNAPSQWELKREPTYESFLEHVGKPKASPYKQKLAQLEGRLDELNTRVLHLEKVLANVIREDGEEVRGDAA